MKSLPFLLLLACLLNTTVSHPMFRSFSRQGQYREREISPTSLLYRGLIPCHQSFPTRSNTAARLAYYLDPYTVLLNTALSHPIFWPFRRQDTPAPAITPLLPTLPLDMLLKIASHAAPRTGHFLGNADKESRAASNLQLPSLDLEDVEKIKNSRPEAKAFYQAILKKDTDAVKKLYQDMDDSEDEELEYIYGLELAVRYKSPQAAWILLACDTLAEMTNAEEREKLRVDAESQLTRTQLADLAIIRRATNSFEREFFKYLILNWQNEAYWGLTSRLTKAARISGLQLAVRYGTNKNILVLLAFSTWDWDMDSKEDKEIVDAAEGKLPQTDLDLLKKIQNSEPEKQDFWRSIVGCGCVSFQFAEAIASDHDTAILGMLLAVLGGRIDAGTTLLILANTDLKKKLIHAAAELATNADKSENLQEIWKRIRMDYAAKGNGRLV